MPADRKCEGENGLPIVAHWCSLLPIVAHCCSLLPIALVMDIIMDIIAHSSDDQHLHIDLDRQNIILKLKVRAKG